MSDLAPLVVSTLRDKVVSDLQQENEALQEEVRATRSVQVVGPPMNNDDNNDDQDGPLGGEVVVFQQAQFDTDGQPGGNPNLWQVTFPDDSQQQQNFPVCPLSHLVNLKILLGGVCMAELDERTRFECWLQDYPNDNDEEKIVSFFMDGVWLNVGIHGWPIADRGDLGIEPEEGMDYLMNVVALQPPAKTVTFKRVSFLARYVRGLLLRLPEETREGVGMVWERDVSPRLGAVLRTMREEGNTLTGPQLMEQAHEVVEALSLFDNSEFTHIPHETIVQLVRLQRSLIEQGERNSFFERVHAALEIARAQRT